MGPAFSWFGTAAATGWWQTPFRTFAYMRIFDTLSASLYISATRRQFGRTFYDAAFASLPSTCMFCEVGFGLNEVVPICCAGTLYHGIVAPCLHSHCALTVRFNTACIRRQPVIGYFHWMGVSRDNFSGARLVAWGDGLDSLGEWRSFMP